MNNPIGNHLLGVRLGEPRMMKNMAVVQKGDCLLELHIMK